jgi:uncharacterized protein YndB with AHSA1/START domain
MSITHGTFVIDRSYPSSVGRVYRACTDPAVKALWFGSPSQPLQMEFRVGGRETNRGVQDGAEFIYEAVFRDIVENERIVTTYDMLMDGRRISVSVATMEFRPDGDGTALTYTEQGAFLDGYDKPEIREQGMQQLLDALGTHLLGDS